MSAPTDARAAEKSSLALDDKGAFHRFRETFHRLDDRWLQAWYQWREKHVKVAIDACALPHVTSAFDILNGHHILLVKEGEKM